MSEENKVLEGAAQAAQAATETPEIVLELEPHAPSADEILNGAQAAATAAQDIGTSSSQAYLADANLTEAEQKMVNEFAEEMKPVEEAAAEKERAAVNSNLLPRTRPSGTCFMVMSFAVEMPPAFLEPSAAHMLPAASSKVPASGP